MPQNTHTLEVINADELQKRLGNRFLTRHKQASAGKQDKLFLLKKNAKVIGAARLEISGKEPQNYWLRNLYIESTERQQGHATTLINAMNLEMSRLPTYCFNTTDLIPFYTALGFKTIPSHALTQQLPSALLAKFLGYTRQGKKITAMLRCNKEQLHCTTLQR